MIYYEEVNTSSTFFTIPIDKKSSEEQKVEEMNKRIYSIEFLLARKDLCNNELDAKVMERLARFDLLTKCERDVDVPMKRDVTIKEKKKSRMGKTMSSPSLSRLTKRVSDGQKLSFFGFLVMF